MTSVTSAARIDDVSGVAGPIHCTLLPSVAGADPAAGLAPERQSANGAALAASTQVLRAGDMVDYPAHVLGEEMGAVLDGCVDIVAADEHYVLSAGEAILIPPGEARRYQCLSQHCVLYRVTVRTDPDGERQS
ncbi:hypothetical protein B0G71_7846 [Paraburkholderia sp. BL27I4N3]|uniref:cupin domain-containing protein n=1 Tax=Paraburkholderia sp. BL27I4N3 TaxID=1938805 RepID=UPI000E22A0F8|nr:cupin domain-containing protein [Paraburkholderia sp. BL27I4N3]REE07353.1 hypothetical protein B0G71_7846 [Paraburkholderia sp. BL27I4N3]